MLALLTPSEDTPTSGRASDRLGGHSHQRSMDSGWGTFTAEDFGSRRLIEKGALLVLPTLSGDTHHFVTYKRHELMRVTPISGVAQKQEQKFILFHRFKTKYMCFNGNAESVIG